VLDEEVTGFEREFAGYCGTSHCVSVASGTEALTVALMALGVGRGDEVITVPNISAPTVSAARMVGARVVLVDVDPVSRTIDPLAFEDAITDRTKAVVPVHLYGQPAAIARIVEIAADRGVHVIEDAAQAHGARVGERRVGAWGIVGCFSFYPTKNLGALGDGGAAVTNEGWLAERMREIRQYGERERYCNVRDGMNSRLDELQAGILRVRLRELDAANERRRQIARAYVEGLRGSGLAVPVEVDESESVYHLFVVQTLKREALRRACVEKGLETAVHYPAPIHAQPGFRDLGYVSGDFPRSERLCRSVVSLPLYPEMTDSEVGRVLEVVREVTSRGDYEYREEA
jgi:dTDP-4-amino-4,6-dideoxygalactose transaminase